jgi:hypothetical protein
MKMKIFPLIMWFLILSTSVSATQIIETDEYVCPKLPPTELTHTIVPEEFSIQIYEGSALEAITFDNEIPIH